MKNEQRNWLEEAQTYGLLLEHPSYDESEEYIMKFRNASGLRHAESDKRGLAPRSLLRKEAIRRYTKGYNTQQNNYIKLAVRGYERDQKALLESGALISTYEAKGSHERLVDNGKKEFGFVNEQGLYWSPAFRRYYSHEDFMVVGPLDRLLTEWGQGTWKEGQNYAGGIAAYRRKCLDDGTALALVNKYKLPVDQILPRLEAFGKAGNRANEVQSTVEVKEIIVEEPTVIEPSIIKVKPSILKRILQFLNLIK